MTVRWDEWISAVVFGLSIIELQAIKNSKVNKMKFPNEREDQHETI